MKKHRRSNKWTYIMYKDSAPENHVEILDRMGSLTSLVRGTIRTSMKKLVN